MSFLCQPAQRVGEPPPGEMVPAEHEPAWPPPRLETAGEHGGQVANVLESGHVRPGRVTDMVDDPDLGGGVNDRVTLFEPGSHGYRIANIGSMQGNRFDDPDIGQNSPRFLWITYQKKWLMPVGEKRGNRM
jgi:hypothetical protein